MESNLRIFLSEYLGSLPERTEILHRKINSGIDWIIYNYGMAINLVPMRLPFFREFEKKAGKFKTEPEFGKDLIFLDKAGKTLYIFVLKAERLNYRNWIGKKFEEDLRRAIYFDFKRIELKNASSIQIILVYNKDDDKGGVDCYEKFVSSQNTTIANGVSLNFERWNLTELVEQVASNLITPDLLPQHLSGLFRYICSQISDFTYGTSEWENQLIPNWKRFIKDVLDKPLDERKLRLIPVVLLMLQGNIKEEPSSIIGWIDIVEWTMLTLWQIYSKLSDKGKNKLYKKLIVNYWLQLYIVELDKYFTEISPLFSTEHGFSSVHRGYSSQLQAINDAYLAYWHIGRLGILSLAPLEFKGTPELRELQTKTMQRSLNWLKDGIHLNPSFLRPLIDLNHIELFEIWLILYLNNDLHLMHKWIYDLGIRLAIRRIYKDNPIPFINSRNSIDGVYEYAISKKNTYNYSVTSSYLLLMLMEFCLILPSNQRDSLLEQFYKSIVGIDDKESNDKKSPPIELFCWIPPDDWCERIFEESVHDGIGITTNNFIELKQDRPLYEKIDRFIKAINEKYPLKIRNNIPASVYILACIKNKSPLPPHFWRQYLIEKIDSKKT